MPYDVYQLVTISVCCVVLYRKFKVVFIRTNFIQKNSFKSHHLSSISAKNNDQYFIIFNNENNDEREQALKKNNDN